MSDADTRPDTRLLRATFSGAAELAADPAEPVLLPEIERELLRAALTVSPSIGSQVVVRGI